MTQLYIVGSYFLLQWSPSHPVSRSKSTFKLIWFIGQHTSWLWSARGHSMHHFVFLVYSVLLHRYSFCAPSCLIFHHVRCFWEKWPINQRIAQSLRYSGRRNRQGQLFHEEVSCLYPCEVCVFWCQRFNLSYFKILNDYIMHYQYFSKI